MDSCQSQIVPAWTMTIGKVMKVIGIPHDDFSPNYLCNELHGCVAIPKYPQIFENAEGST